MSMTEVLPLIDSLPHAEKFRLIQFLLSKLAIEEGISLETQKTALFQHNSSLKSVYHNTHHATAPTEDWLLMTPEEQRHRLNRLPNEYEKESSEELIRIIEESHLITTGYGNYTEEREQLFANMTVDDVISEIDEMREQGIFTAMRKSHG